MLLTQTQTRIARLKHRAKMARKRALLAAHAASGPLPPTGEAFRPWQWRRQGSTARKNRRIARKKGA